MKKRKLLVAMFSFFAATACLTGGTYAWYVVNNTTPSINITGQTTRVQDGIKLSYREYVSGSNTAYTPVANNKTGLTLTNNVLSPVTSGAFADNETLTLKAAPTYAVTTIDTAAARNTYISFELKFETGTQSTNIYLDKDAVDFAFANADGDVATHLRKSLRIAFESDETSSESQTTHKALIFAPGYGQAKASVSTNVGGIADLNGDGVYDYKLNQAGKHEEIYYGSYVANTLTTNDVVSADDMYTENGSFTEGYGSPMQKGYNTSWSKANHIANPYNSNQKHDLVKTSATAETQAAHGADYFDPSNQHYLTKTNTQGVATLKVTMWLEGWDKDCTNDIASTSEVTRRSLTSTLAFIAPTMQTDTAVTA